MTTELRQVDRPEPPRRPADGHKGTFGTVVVVAGSATMVGAPAIVARAAFRSGAGLVKVAVPKEIVASVLTIEPGATAIALASDPHQQADEIEGADPKASAVLAMGPGLGNGESERTLVSHLLNGPRPVVLDADGLNRLAEFIASGNWWPSANRRMVLTPHPGEFRRLADACDIDADPIDPAKRPDAAAKLAEPTGGVVVLKGHRTVVTDGDRLYVNDTGNSAMATAGSGDVLTGVIAALIAQGLDLFDAACVGVWAHGKAGDTYIRNVATAGLLARELADEIPRVLFPID